jgi:hypothetical protein
MRRWYDLECGFRAAEGETRPPERAVPDWDGSVAGGESGQLARWVRFARWCLRRRLNPVTIVRGRLRAFDGFSFLPPLSEILRPPVDPKREQGITREFAHQLAWNLSFQPERWTLAVSAHKHRNRDGDDQKASVEALLDRHYDFDPVFRVIVARRLLPLAPGRVQDLIEDVLPTALECYVLDRATYDDVLREQIPAAFRDYADAFYRVIDRPKILSGD